MLPYVKPTNVGQSFSHVAAKLDRRVSINVPNTDSGILRPFVASGRQVKNIIDAYSQLTLAIVWPTCTTSPRGNYRVL